MNPNLHAGSVLVSCPHSAGQVYHVPFDYFLDDDGNMLPVRINTCDQSCGDLTCDRCVSSVVRQLIGKDAPDSSEFRLVR